ncbi:MAG TPA: Gp37 family protein [Candidatus Binataceae bacterium]|nr:Gp37 family protein [Candidatus Binataceae bacterium]
MAAIVLDGPWAGSSFAPPLPIDIGTIELAIVAQLTSQITTVEVAHFPDVPQAYRLTHRIGAALVRYQGADYGPLHDTAAIVQERSLKFAVSLLVRDVGWSYGGEPGGTSPGGYALIESVRRALTGFRLPGFSKIYPVREKFLERDKQGGVWIYEISFALKTLAVEPSSVDNYPLFVLGVAQEKGGITTVTVAAAPYSFDVNGEITLPNGNITAIQVLNPSTGTAYSADADYSVNAVSGVIYLDPTGAIQLGATVHISYSYGDIVVATPAENSNPTSSES